MRGFTVRELAIVLAIVFVVGLIVTLSLGGNDRCIETAPTECIPNSIRWDEDECECSILTQSQNGNMMAEIEWDISGCGGMVDD